MKASVLTLTLVVPASLFAQGGRTSTSLRVVDAQGVEVVVADARIDYGGMVVPDMLTDGIRLQQGDGAVLMKWTAVDSIRVVAINDSTRPPMLRVQVVLRSGVRRNATLAEKGHMELLGQTDLGEYSLDLHKVRVIVPVR
jgi:hypothetical protein